MSRKTQDNPSWTGLILRVSPSELAPRTFPQVLKSCTDFVEEHGIVDGIYRLCGIASNVQKLRQEFDMERPPDLNKSTYLQDVHCVSSLCKAYFRELPNPLLTYQLYDKFADAVAIQLEEQRLIKIREVLKDLPIPHYRTLEYLMKHLVHMASFSSQTNMHARNLAIVWAPNLLRSKDIESSGFNGTAAFMEVRVQSIVVEFILTHVEQLFGDGTNPGKENEGSTSATMIWPSCVPEEYYRSLSYNLPSMLHHGDGPPQMRPYHTVIELADPKRKGSLKAKKWKSIFNLGRSNNDSKRKSHKQDDKEGKSDKMNLRPAKSMDSLSSVPTDAVDLEQSGLKRRSPKHQLPIRRESFGAESKQEKLGYIFLDSGEQSLPMETNYTEYEEEAQAKSEPTTPKPGRSSIVTIPQGRSPKSNQNRAEKCVGVHISGPFSVTLPFHITSNLSRLTRGMECPSLNYTVLHSSEKLFSQEHVSTECDDKEKPTLVSDKGKEGSEPSMREDSDPKMENNRISLEVQDSFSFLDNQDTSLEVNTADASQSEEETFTDKIPEYSVDSEILEYELQSKVQMVEFSVEPPPDDLCTEDESEQMYYMPTGCLDTEEQWRETHDSLEDIYLSAYDDLNPLADELYANKLDDDNTVHGESEEIESMALSTENQGTEKYCTLYDLDQLEVPHADEQWHYVPSCIQTDIDTMASNTQCDGSHNNMPDTEVHCGLHLEDDATIENVADTPESGSCVVEPQIAYGHNNDLEDEATAENLGFSELHDRDLYSKSNLEVEANVDISSPKEVQGHIKEDIVEDDDTLDSSGPKELEDGGLYIKEDIVEDDGTVDSSGPKELQDGGLYRKDGILEDEDTVDRSGPKELQDGGLYRKDGILEDEDTVDSSGPKELKDGGLYSKNNSMGLQPTVENLVSCELQDHRHYSKDDILVDTTRAVEPRTSDDGMAYVQNLDIIVGKALLESADFKEEPHYSMSNINMHQNVDEAINLSDSSLLGKDCMSDSGAGSVPSSSHVETTEEQHWENEASHCEEPESISGNQLCYKDNSQPHPCSYAEGDELMKSNGLPDRINVNPLLKDHFIPQVGSIDSKPEEVNPVYSSEEQRPTHLTKSPVELEITVTTGTYHDGAVAMKMASTINKIQQAKSVPVVPPKPQFAKLPPALKTIIHVSSTLTPNRDTKPHKSEKSSRAETAESCTDSAAKRRSSWRNATSVSFDTAMALAKERQQSQHPVRRMQTYCIGDSYDVMDSSKMDNPPHVQKITVKSASNRTNRPYTCMSPTSAEAELRALPREERNTLTIHGSQPVISSEPDVYTKELPNRNRLSMPRLGTQAGGDDSISTSHQQRRSLL